MKRLGTSQQENKNGFTIVELLIIVVVIGILAALVLNSFSGAQKSARDRERQTDVKSIAKYLEVFYIDNGYYPAGARLTNASADTWVATNMPNLSKGALIAPGASATSMVGNVTPGKNAYGYKSYVAGGSASNTTCSPSTESTCQEFELYYFEEVANTTTKVVSIARGT